ncbi:hypothetical protein AAHE18_05G288800 [Arachis hypogaea]
MRKSTIAGRLPKASGISPDNLLSDKFNQVMFLSFPRTFGIFPVRLFCARSRSTKFNASTTLGISPERLFWKRYNMVRFFSRNKLLGIPPVKPFCDISKFSKSTISPMFSPSNVSWQFPTWEHGVVRQIQVLKIRQVSNLSRNCSIE